MDKIIIDKRRLRELCTLLAGLGLYCVICLIFHIPCPIHYLTGISCPGCGMSRSVLALLRLDFSAALYYHPLIPYLLVAAPVLAALHLTHRDRLRKILVLASAVLMVLVYLWRLIVVRSPVLDFSPASGLLGRIFLWITGLFS